MKHLNFEAFPYMFPTDLFMMLSVFFLILDFRYISEILQLKLGCPNLFPVRYSAINPTYLNSPLKEFKSRRTNCNVGNIVYYISTT